MNRNKQIAFVRKILPADWRTQFNFYSRPPQIVIEYGIM